MIKAIARGKLFNGKVDRYVLEDGRRVISQRGIIAGIGGRESGDLGPYIDRLSNRSELLSVGAEYAPPAGGDA